MTLSFKRAETNNKQERSSSSRYLRKKPESSSRE